MKIKTQLFFLSFIVLSFSGYTQIHSPDSLKNALQKANADTNKVRILLKLSTYYLDSSTEDAKRYALLALELARQLKFNPGRALALKNIGMAYYYQGNTPA